MAVLTPELRQLAAVERELANNQLFRYKPYPKQVEFHTAGGMRGVRDRLLIAGNQLGKTLSASRETAMHLTGMYPTWWKGARFLRPTTGWAASLTSQGTRDTVQRLLLGPPGQFGTGAIPKKLIEDTKKATHGVADAVETIIVRHEPTGGFSRLTLKTYDQGRERWQGDTLNFLWFDEEPPEDIYDEGLTRLVATGGISYMTFTPLLGMSKVVARFLKEKRAGTHVTQMTIHDALHFTDEERAAVIARYPEHQREARALGKPLLGSGMVFPYPEESIKCSPMVIPQFWPRICAIDFGYDHPTAVVWMAWDRDTDTVYVYDCYRRKETLPAVHAAVIRAKGAWIPCAWPHDGDVRDARNAGDTFAQQYRGLGVNMLNAKATHAPDRKQGQKEGDGGTSFEAGITMMGDRLMTGRLKVVSHLADWFEEYGLYHRKDGLVVKEQDDLMSATRVGLMMLRHAKVRQEERMPSVRSFVPFDAGMGALG